jgi:hypothetical protein
VHAEVRLFQGVLVKMDADDSTNTEFIAASVMDPDPVFQFDMDPGSDPPV